MATIHKIVIIITATTTTATIYMMVQCLQLIGGHRRGHGRRHRPLSAPQARIGCARVQRHRGNVIVRHHLEDYVLVAVAERRPERICRVRRTGAMQHDGTIAGGQTGTDFVPFTVRTHSHWRSSRLRITSPGKIGESS